MQRGVAEPLRGRRGRGGRHDAVALRDPHEGRPGPGGRVHHLPRDPPRQPPGLVAPVPAGQALPRHRGGQRDAVVQPVLQRDEEAGALGRRVEPREGAELLRHAEGVEHREERLDGIDRQRAGRLHERLEPRQQGGGRPGAPRGIGPGMEIPGGGEQRERPHPVRPAQRRRHREQPAHAVPGQHHRAGRGHERAFEPPGDIVGQGEAALLLPRPAPVEQQGAEALPRQPSHERARGKQVEHIGAVHQGRDKENGRPLPAIIQQAGSAFGPQRRRVRCLPREGVAAIGRHAGDQGAVGAQQAGLDGAAQRLRRVAGGGEGGEDPRPFRLARLRDRPGAVRARPGGRPWRPGQACRRGHGPQPRQAQVQRQRAGAPAAERARHRAAARAAPWSWPRASRPRRALPRRPIARPVRDRPPSRRSRSATGRSSPPRGCRDPQAIPSGFLAAPDHSPWRQRTERYGLRLSPRCIPRARLACRDG